MKNPVRTITTETNRAQIYEWMLYDVLERVHDPSGKPIIQKASEKVAELLELVAVTAWHNGDVRATTKTRVKDHCDKANLKHVLDEVFPDSAKSDITSIFLAFYFQESYERVGQERAFEFSHKSYGEYLVARRIKRFFVTLHKNLKERNWTEEEALKRWAELFGPASLTRELHDFVYDVVELASVEDRNAWRKDFVQLFGAMARIGMPVHQFGLPNFMAMMKHDRHASLALFVLHCACYRLGDPVFEVDWPTSKTNAGIGKGQIFLRLLGHREYGEICLLNYLCGWDWKEVDLVGANLKRATLYGATLVGANLMGANFYGANLVGANLVGANLSVARLYGATLGGAHLGSANVILEQLLMSVGEPRTMPDGRPPKKNWRKPKSPRKKKLTKPESTDRPENTNSTTP